MKRASLPDATFHLLVEVAATQEILFEFLALALAKGEPTAYEGIMLSKTTALSQKKEEVWERMKAEYP